MKKLALIIALFVSPAIFASIEFKIPNPPRVSDEVILHFIAMKETGNNPGARGSCGERTQFQIMPSTWRQYSRLPHSSAASNPAESEYVARSYLADIRANLQKRGLPETAYFIAASWHAGINWTSTTESVREYAQCVENLVASSEFADR
jgi:hypothetical protein